MKITPRKINIFLLFKLPSAFFCGVRLKSITAEKCVTTVKYRWINQNPFNSMYFAVQAMAAELSTGALVMKNIKSCNENISMLVIKNSSSYSKKATGRITFSCENGELVREMISKAITTKIGQSETLISIGKDEKGEQVSIFEFEWSVKLKS